MKSKPLDDLGTLVLSSSPGGDEGSGLSELLESSEWAYGRNFTLTHREIGYEVDLTRITRTEEMLEWIMQINEKTWASSRTVGELVRLLGFLFGGHPAPGGKSVSLDITAAVKNRPLLERDYS